MQNLIYALIQAIHNFGAATVIGTAASALWLVRGNAAVQHRLASLMAMAWVVQMVSGTGFGVTSLYYEGHLPDIHGIAVFALFVKIVCAIIGFVLAVTYARCHAGWDIRKQLFVWRALFVLGVAALSAAAFLRWFS